ncbi:MAG: formate dehydrogenase accessory sulfurtransferase FdhD [Candidatus Helarchaeota archaeon]
MVNNSTEFRELVIEKHDVTRIHKKEYSRSKADIAKEKTSRLMINDEIVIKQTYTPKNIKEMVIGFLISEGFIQKSTELKSLEIHEDQISIQVEKSTFNLKKTQEMRLRLDPQPIQVHSDLMIDVATIFKAQDYLNDNCKLWKLTGGTHAACIVNEMGKIIALNEDIGRHNAFDKAIGHIYLNDMDPSKLFIVSTSRQSASMVLKVIRARIPIIISNAAPLSHGLYLAAKYNVTLVGFARYPSLTIYTHPERIL